MPPTTRIGPLAPEHWDPRTRELLGGTLEPVAKLEGRGGARGGSGPLAILRTLAHHPRLLEPFLGWAATLAARGVLPRRESELLALRTAWNCASPFEWGHHVLYARAAGLSESEIARVPGGPDVPGWSEADRTLLRAADELHAGQDLSDATFAALRARYDPAQLVEIPFVVGQYTMLSMVAQATGVQPEAGLPALPGSGPWTVGDMRALASRHAGAEAQRDLEGTLATLVAEPVYEFWPAGLRFSGGEKVRRYYQHLFSEFVPRTRHYELVSEWADETSVAQEYLIDVEVDGRVERHHVIGILLAEGRLLGGERVYASERCMRLMVGEERLGSP